MSGADTIRGIAFQTAVALAEAISMVTDPAAVMLRVEGKEDVVDYEVIGAAGKRLRVRQAKTKTEPYSWTAAGLLPVLQSWAALPDVKETAFEFITDGQLGPSGVQLSQVICKAKAGAEDAEIAAMASSMGRAGSTLPPAELLRRVTITTRAGSLNQILDILEHKTLLLMQRARPASIEHATAVVDGLFRHLFVVGGDQQPSSREVSRHAVLERLRLSEADLAAGEAWGDETVRRHAEAILADPVRDDIVTLGVLPAASLPRVLRLTGPVPEGGERHQEPVTVLLDGAPSLLIGATGEGKTTSLRALERHAAERGDVPVLISAGGHQPGALPHRVRARVEAVLGTSLAAGAVEVLLADPRIVLLVDGVSESDGQTREALRADLARLTALGPLRFVLAGRDLAAARPALPDLAADAGAFRLISLDHATRRAIAHAHRASLASNGTVSDIERRLGRAVDNPMLFAMALAVVTDIGVITDRPQVYEQFLRGLTARARIVDPEFDLLVLGGAYTELINTGQRAADPYIFLDLLGSSLQRAEQLPAWRGATGSPADILARAQTIGLLWRPDPDAGLIPVHDSFADYLAAVAVARGAADLPAQLTAAHDEQILFFTEIAGLSSPLSQQLAVQDSLLACRVATGPAGDGDADPDEVVALLRLLRAGRNLTMLDAGGLRIVRHPDATMLVLGGNGNATANLSEYQQLAGHHPSIILPPRSGSLRVAIHAWASAVRFALRPREPLFTPQPGNDPDMAVQLLTSHAYETERVLESLIRAVLAGTADRVQETLGPRALTAMVGDPEPDPFGEPRIPVHFRHGRGPTLVTRSGDPRGDPSFPATRTSADRLLERHPSTEAADLVTETLIALTHQTWPVP